MVTTNILFFALPVFKRHWKEHLVVAGRVAVTSDLSAETVKEERRTIIQAEVKQVKRQRIEFHQETFDLHSLITLITLQTEEFTSEYLNGKWMKH